MKALVTGAAGFIGSNLVDRLLKDGWVVDGVDNLSTGNQTFLSQALKYKNFTFYKLDLLTDKLNRLSHDYDFIFHLAANADIRGGNQDTSVDLHQNIIVTHNILEFAKRVMSRKNVVFVFSSTAAMLGEPSVFPTPEDVSIPKQTSLYGASKMACEALISAYSNTFDIEAYAFRFVSILGPRYSHGHVFDFVKKLKNDPDNLKILGNGKAEKSYLHVDDCLSGVFKVAIEHRTSKNLEHKFDTFNLGLDETIFVSESAKLISDCMRLTPNYHFEHQLRGWIGDNKFVHLSTAKLRSLGWKPLYSIDESIKATVSYLLANPEILEMRT